MILLPGQHVKCFLRNSTVLEGIVKECNTELQLQTLDGKSLLIIHHPQEDIMITKVVLHLEDVEKEEESVEVISSNLQPEFQEIVSQENEINLRTQSLVELRQLKSKQERKIVATKLKNHNLGQVQKVTYGQPGFLKGSRTE